MSLSDAAMDMIADSVPSFNIDDTPVTLRTRPTRAKLVSTMLRQRSISQNVATSRVPTRTTSALSRLLAIDNPGSPVKDEMVPSSFSPSSLSSVPSISQASANISLSEEISTHLSSTNLGKPSSVRRSRSSITRTDAVESPLALPYSDLAVKVEPNELQPVQAEAAGTIALSMATSSVVTSMDVPLSRTSPTKAVSMTATSDSSAELGECKLSEVVVSRISPIARNNQTLLQHLKRPPSFPGIPPDAVDVKKLRVSPVTDVKSPTMDAVLRSSAPSGESKTSHSVDHLSSSLSVTLNLPLRQPLSVNTNASNTTTSSTISPVAPGSQAVAAKSNVISPRFVSCDIYSCIRNLFLYWHSRFSDIGKGIPPNYLPSHLVSGEGIMSLSVRLSCCCAGCVCLSTKLRLHISHGGEGNALYPVLSSCSML